VNFHLHELLHISKHFLFKLRQQRIVLVVKQTQTTENMLDTGRLDRVNVHCKANDGIILFTKGASLETVIINFSNKLSSGSNDISVISLFPTVL